MLNEINIDYIGVVRKKEENYLYEEREITTNKKLIDKLQAIAEDDTKSILDMQECMHEAFGDTPKPVHRVALPENYDTFFVLPASYPNFIDEEQYENECRRWQRVCTRRMHLKSSRRSFLPQPCDISMPQILRLPRRRL